MVSRVSQTTFNCTDADALSEWWKPVHGCRDLPGDPNEPGDTECMLIDPESGHRLLFIEVGGLAEPSGRVHLDLAPTDRPRDDEVDRVIGLGAEPVEDHRNADGTGWMILSDPAGYRFCLLRSDEERDEVPERTEGAPHRGPGRAVVAIRAGQFSRSPNHRVPIWS